MKVTNPARKTVLCSRVELADSWWRRLCGYLGRSSAREGEGILLRPCSAIHTLGMRFDLDILFLDGDGTVLKTVRSMPPWKVTGMVAGARSVLEVPVGTIDSSATEIGDVLSWADPPQTE